MNDIIMQKSKTAAVVYGGFGRGCIPDSKRPEWS